MERMQQSYNQYDLLVTENIKVDFKSSYKKNNKGYQQLLLRLFAQKTMSIWLLKMIVAKEIPLGKLLSNRILAFSHTLENFV